MLHDKVDHEIKSILDANKLRNLRKLIRTRSVLNNCNMYLSYIFYIVQSAAILVTSASYYINTLIWIGTALQVISLLIIAFEKNNNTILKNMINDIRAIKEGTYIDNSAFVEIDKNAMNTYVFMKKRTIPHDKINKDIIDTIDEKNEITTLLSDSKDTQVKKIT
jgi:hypothetical protein